MGNKINETFLDRSSLAGEFLLDGNANDTSGNGNNGTATNVTWSAAERGYVEEVADFNGSSSYIDVTSSNSVFSGDYTWSGFVKFDNLSGTRGIVYYGKSGMFQYVPLNLYTDGTTLMSQARTGTTGVASINCGTVNTGKWYNIIQKRTGSTVEVFVDNISVGTSSDAEFGETNTSEMTRCILGAFGSSLTLFLDGNIGLSRIYNKALTQDEIKDLYHEGLRKLGPTNLANRSQGFPKYSLANLENGKVLEISKAQSGGVYYDQTGGGNDGTPTSVTDSTVGLNNVMTLSSGNISWPNTSFSTALCWEQISGKWVLQENPTYITSTGVSVGTRTISNIVLYNRLLSNDEIYQFRYGNTII